jgi:hypothetical protein
MQIHPILLYLIFSLLASPLTKAGDVVQTQSATSGGYEADVIKASAKGDILTVQLAYRNTGNENVELMYALQNVYYIDEKEKKKYHVLKDSQNVYLGSPNLLNDINTRLIAGGKLIVWFKFPAPPVSTTKISLIVPEVLPFEDLPIFR